MTTQNYLVDLERAVKETRADIDSHRSRILSGSPSMPYSWRRSVILGIASIFDFTGRLSPQYRPVRDPAKKDTSALAEDWRTVGDDLRRVMTAARSVDLSDKRRIE